MLYEIFYGFLIPQDKIDKLIAHKNLLTKKQKQDILTALQTGNGLQIKPTPKRSGGALGTLLASIGIPMLMNSVLGNGLQSRKPTGQGMQNRPSPFMNVGPPPFYGRWDGMGMKKRQKKDRSRVTTRKNSPLGGIRLLGSIF